MSLDTKVRAVAQTSTEKTHGDVATTPTVGLCVALWEGFCNSPSGALQVAHVLNAVDDLEFADVDFEGLDSFCYLSCVLPQHRRRAVLFAKSYPSVLCLRSLPFEWLDEESMVQYHVSFDGIIGHLTREPDYPTDSQWFSAHELFFDGDPAIDVDWVVGGRRRVSFASDSDGDCASDMRGAYLDRQQRVNDEMLAMDKDRDDDISSMMLEASATDKGEVQAERRGVVPALYESLHEYSGCGRTCFSAVCAFLGVDLPRDATSVSSLSKVDVARLSVRTDYKLFFVAYTDRADSRNHVELVDHDAKSVAFNVSPVGAVAHYSRAYGITSLQQFFNSGGAYYYHDFYSQFGADLEPLGGGLQAGSVPGTGAGDQGATSGRLGASSVGARRDQEFAGGEPGLAFGAHGSRGGPSSVVEEGVSAGTSNVSGGVVRSRKRVIQSRAGFNYTGEVSKNYRVSSAVMFNNIGELFLDALSRELAQEVIECVFSEWGVPMDQPESAKYAEDLLFTFMIASTASNKADYNRAFDVPVKPFVRNGVRVDSVEADFAVLSRVLESKYTATRRAFARGIADDLRGFLRLDDNSHFLPTLATRAGCELQLAGLVFDGSTHCTGMTTREINFTKLLESRNLFENEAALAQGASDRLMSGLSSGSRSAGSR